VVKPFLVDPLLRNIPRQHIMLVQLLFQNRVF